MQSILLKDQFIFGVTVHEIQEHLLNDIEDDHDLNRLQGAHKIESHLAHRKLLGLKSIQYDSIGNQRSRHQKKKFKPKDKRPQSRSQSGIRDCKYCGTNHQHRQCPAHGKTCKSCGRKNHFAKKCRSKGQSQSHTGTGSKKSFKYREVNVDQESSDDGQIDEITSKVRSMYYNDVYFNNVNTHMYIKLNTKSCNGNSLKTHFKVNTGADGNLLPRIFFKNFPNANMTQLAKTIDIGTKLYAYNNTEIKHLGVCELLVEYRECCTTCQFYVVDFPTAIL